MSPTVRNLLLALLAILVWVGFVLMVTRHAHAGYVGSRGADFCAKVYWAVDHLPPERVIALYRKLTPEEREQAKECLNKRYA